MADLAGKTLLIISGGVEAADAARRAKEMGLTVVVSDRDHQAPGFAFADSCLIADVYGPSETAAAAERYSRKVRRIDGVICVAADAPVTAATVAQRLRLPGLPVHVAELACDKLAMKRCFRSAGVAVPWFDEVRTPQELQRIAIERGRDLVIKPVDSRGSRGVQRVAQVADLTAAFLLARQYSPSERVMVEQYLEGPQVSTESIVTSGQCFTPGFSDRNYEYLEKYAPYFVENGGDLPSHLPPDIQDKVRDLVARAASAMGVTDGTVKGDIVIHKGEPYVIELAARLSGGFFCTREIPLNTGVDFIGAAIRIALGEPVSPEELSPRHQRPVIQRYAFPQAGTVTGISGAEEARAIPGIAEVVVTAREGDIIPSAGDKRPSAAMVLATGATREAALKAANDALALIRVGNGMTLAVRPQDVGAEARTLAFAFFHLNLAFSSISEEKRGDVIARCYHPLLDLAQAHGPIGLEITGYTLEEIAARDPAWIARARALIAAGRIELIGSGYSQMIGPLVPARVTRENLRLGQDICERLLGLRPRLALVNEQAYAAGLVGLYLDAGFDALLMDYDNPAALHPEWDARTGLLPQYALGADGRRIALLWSNTTLFQQMQRFVHGDTTLQTYARFVGAKARPGTALCLYASDAEIFDFRPGRFKTEEKLPAHSEWQRMGEAFAELAQSGLCLCAPSTALRLLDAPGAGRDLRLESAVCPVPVKKQRKYNLARWAVTGRDNTAINAACQRIYEAMLRDEARADWKELCFLWASDFRTHLTAPRWDAYCARLQAAETRWPVPAIPLPMALGETRQERHITLNTPSLSAMLDRRRGLALQSLQFAGQDKPVLGGLPHGFFDDITLQADWYTGDSVFEAPGEHKLTDLEWADTRIGQDDNGDVLVCGQIESPLGRIEKHMRFCAGAPRVEFDLLFHWQDWGKGVLRLGHFTLLPDAFTAGALHLSTTNGGPRERFALANTAIDQGAPVSFLVSSSHGFGMTEGWAEIGDARTGLKITVDRATAPLLGLLTHRRVGDSFFCQIQLSALELDDTRKPAPYRGGARRFRFAVGAL